jgi:predicted anti-sigma-YlaC factor YlaD
MENHLTDPDVDSYVEQQMDCAERVRVDNHLAGCSACRSRVAREQRLEGLLRAMPRSDAPRDLSARINAAVDLRVGQERARRERLPLIILATFLSLIVTFWFGLQMLIGLQEEGALDLFSLVTSHPEIFSAYSTDAFFALAESLPILEMVLTLFALLTVIVLVQQWLDTTRTSVRFYHNGHG